MTYIPHSPKERDAMLATIGVKNLEDLFKDIPAKHRFPDLDLPPALTEMEAAAELAGYADANETTQSFVSFLGAGAYNHYIPAAIDHILRRGEFYTAYTPYQPEISQGTLQAIFEYQSMMTLLTGMEVSNASHYDGATAVAEAANMAYAQFRGKRTRMVISPTVNPQYRETLRTYTQGMGLTLAGDDTRANLDGGPETIEKLIDENTALVIVQYPDYFGRIYDYTRLADAVHAAGALFCVTANPTALAILKTPGEMGADIVVGEGQPLGIPLSFGGPYLGFFTTQKKYIHKMAGRLVGETVDNRGQRAFVLTLTAREQHIKRERATSNICSNQGLLALASAVYLSLLGQTGFRQVAELCYHKAHYAAEQISKLKGYHLCFDTPFFHEFSVCCPKPVAEINAHLLEHGILGGYDLGQDYPALKDHMLIAVTEMNTREEIDLLVEILEEVSHD
ncbi:MAG: glycine dehydrogenase (aminomethyl-transferring) [Chloroflexi bacterium GWB2_49_20]|nr:MAG: glycine dehydrogenase (aminomethyl-transferring) [Chloroflexi bacterium GWB2_49_20]OGN79857.1 MAG: glycine dehydrogenase (aminomethyl-transferring) [Chloroflexi bacterium GWC2_49_37]OGN85608.1 MAG: glycine dehydrogenase (aminomethyl-transferring) [Chloroflexi bacterium GWD2_49_16]HBG74487.1 aminomethyl-transferring glycine dehydrogenase subunit GcvPA [Anaerolineae bacterium]HCC79640.1 aminomethyl-transferring glycine dehydrogenase subunit GcvPA [Anaerolineae bacterium]